MSFIAKLKIVNFSVQLHMLVKKLCLFLISILAISEISIVLLRYIYGIGFLKLHDIALYSFSALVVMSIIYTFGVNEHVRVDVFREKHSQKQKSIIDCIAVIFFLIPFFSLILFYVWPDIKYAWSIYEGSRETGGLAGLFLVKSCLPLACILMIIQGIVVVMRGGVYLFDTSDQNTAQTGESL